MYEKGEAMKFLVTGGAGFIGSHIAEALAKKGEVLAYDNLSVGKRENVPEECTLMVGDLLDTKKLSDAMEDVDVVLHNAAFVSIRGSFERLVDDINVNCIGTLNVLNAAVKKNVKKVVFASSMAVYGEPKYLPVDENHPLIPISPYGLSKVRGEMYCKAFQEKYGMKTVVLRYFNTYGVRQTPSSYVGVISTFIDNALHKRPLTIFGYGTQTRDFVWVKDVVSANISAATTDVQGIFNVGSGIEMSINQVADLVISHLGGEKIHSDLPEGEIKRIAANTSNAKKYLRYAPQSNLKKTMPELIEWLKEKRN